MTALGPEWNAVFREPVDAARATDVLRILASVPSRGWGRSSVVLQAPYLGHDAVRDPFKALARDVADQAAGLRHAGRINFAFRRHDVDQPVDGPTKVFILQVLQLVRQQDDQHVFVRGQCAGDPGIEFHSCCAPPSMAGVVALAPASAHRNRKAIFSTGETRPLSRTAFAAARAGVEALYRALVRLGDLVAAVGARISRGAA